ncbi:transmembrane protein 79 [Phyllopteryx taeniolatus]|uniref:transmembrane protein 79 n=1 Tax=Phyllopteryx taeniolatus TaxID=161469 RepID=UPI002AD5A235|nr:transmembrane protein 79 [Phyllopteryx taeniolatus]XP_061616688.1 transmembrane protein 79 [Phyllopteryx taeniolatus]XP_061616689.1 transmembrane protein 79 [Phyllopteryx taeniolatus]XP_061616690.1 transmembrane protein 79 [Phyllopteryx taeniolatus]
MSGEVSREEEVAALLPIGLRAQCLLTASEKTPEEELEEERDEEDKDDEVTGAGDITLPWPGDRDKRSEDTDGVSSGVCVSDAEDKDEDDALSKAKWRESMPEGDKWRDDLPGAPRDEGDGSLADEEEESHWVPEKGTMGFTPQVKIVRRQSSEVVRKESKLDMDMEDHHYYDKDNTTKSQMATPLNGNWNESQQKKYLCDDICSETLKLAMWTASAALVFPFLVWGGYALLPFDSPLMGSAPHRVVYTLRCAVFASVPILLGVVVQGVARICYGEVKPSFQTKARNGKASVHGHYVSQSVGLFLFYFLQLAVLASYVNHDLIKLVPLLTVIFVFGRLIYWLCLSLGSSIRGLGFGLSFFPMLVMLAANLYFVSSSAGPEAVFDVEPPTTAPPPQQRSWWG